MHKYLRNSKPINLGNLRGFGCVSYNHFNQGKLRARSLKCYFVGYPLGVKYYKLWYPSLSKHSICRNIVFTESSFSKYFNVEPTLRNDIGIEFEMEVDVAPFSHVNVLEVRWRHLKHLSK